MKLILFLRWLNLGRSCYGRFCRRDSVPNGRFSVSERRVLWAELSIACAPIGVAEVIFTPSPPSILRIGICLLFIYLFILTSMYRGLEVIRCGRCYASSSSPFVFCDVHFHSTLGLFFYQLSYFWFILFLRAIGFYYLNSNLFAHFRQVILLSNLRSSFLKIHLVGNFGQVRNFNLFFEPSRLRKVRDLPIVLLMIYTWFLFPIGLSWLHYLSPSL